MSMRKNLLVILFPSKRTEHSILILLIQVHSHAPLHTLITTEHSCATKCSHTSQCTTMIQVHSHEPLCTDITTVHSCATKWSPMIQVYSHTSQCTTMIQVHSHVSQCTHT